MERIQDRAGATAAFSVFANEGGETLAARMKAAKELELALAALPESNVQGPIRSAMLKCKLAATFGQSHRDVTDYFCEVSALLSQAEGDTKAHEGLNIDRRLSVTRARHYNSMLLARLREGLSRESPEAENLRFWRKMWILGAREA